LRQLRAPQSTASLNAAGREREREREGAAWSFAGTRAQGGPCLKIHLAAHGSTPADPTIVWRASQVTLEPAEAEAVAEATQSNPTGSGAGASAWGSSWLKGLKAPGVPTSLFKAPAPGGGMSSLGGNLASVGASMRQRGDSLRERMAAAVKEVCHLPPRHVHPRSTR
jgi:hypothetical protein